MPDETYPNTAESGEKAFNLTDLPPERRPITREIEPYRREQKLSDVKSLFEAREKLGFETLEDACSHIVEKNLAEIEFALPESEFPFHSRGHSEFFVKGVGELSQVIRNIAPEEMPEEKILILKTLGSGHDRTQKFEINPEIHSRKRQRGFNPELVGKKLSEMSEEDRSTLGNEQHDGKQMAAELQRDVYGDLFKNVDEQAIEQAIGATTPQEVMIRLEEYLPIDEIPDYYRGETRTLTILQPNSWREGATIDEAVMALSDLAEAYGTKDTDERTIKSGNSEFRELMMGVTEKIKTAAETENGIAAITPEERFEIASKILSWWESQEGFILGQKANMEMILEKNDAINASSKSVEIKAALKERFSHFNENAQQARRLYEENAARLLSPQYVENYTLVNELERRQRNLLSEIGKLEADKIGENPEHDQFQHYQDMKKEEYEIHLKLNDLTGTEFPILDLDDEAFTDLCREMGYET